MHGSSWGDFAFRGVVGTDSLIAEGVAHRWRNAGLRGLMGFEPVELSRVRGSSMPPPNYLRVGVGITESRIDAQRSLTKRAEPGACDRC